MYTTNEFISKLFSVPSTYKTSLFYISASLNSTHTRMQINSQVIYYPPVGQEGVSLYWPELVTSNVTSLTSFFSCHDKQKRNKQIINYSQISLQVRHVHKARGKIVTYNFWPMGDLWPLKSQPLSRSLPLCAATARNK